MTIHDAYDKFLDLVNRNSINDNATVSQSQFVRAFNIAQNNFISWTIEKSNQKDRRLIQKLVVLRDRLSGKVDTVASTSYNLPTAYHEFINTTAYASQGECKKQPMFMEEIKGENVSVHLSDDNNKPSFKYREGKYQIAGNAIVLYKNELDVFSYSDVYLDYYRNPVQVDIIGYVDVDGKDSKDIDPEFSDRVVQKILLIAAKDFNTNNDDLENYQVDINRINSKI